MQGSYDLFRPGNSDLLRRMQDTPSQLPNLSIYQAWQQDPNHFDENMHVYARQLGVSQIGLLLKTTDFGPLERAIQQCDLLPEVAETFARELPGLMKMYSELFPPQH